MSYQRQYTAEGDARIGIRRCQKPLPLTRMLYLKDDRRTVEPLELEIAEQLPDVCSAHGQSAVSRKPIRVIFYDTKRHPRSPHASAEGRPPRIAPISTILVGQWPVCDRCTQAGRRKRQVARLLIAVMVANFAVLTVLIAAAWAGFKADFAYVQPLIWGFFPGSVPIGMVVAVWLYKRESEPVTFRPIDGDEFAFVRAHPKFRAALPSGGGD
ncbi:hypothetical protein [Nocardia lasii]|uniref:Uncharacterized protein n=1 Tax=Nocardia lasii TaxID=1616107 RepID=A0ABW1JQZ3_9NOCA